MRFQGIVLEDGCVDINAKLKTRSQLAFEWVAAFGEIYEAVVVHVKCGNAFQQGIPKPEGWETALRNSKLHEAARAAACSLQANEIYSNIDCRALGVPKVAPVGNGDDEVGGIVHLKEPDATRQDYLLCAHVRDSTWICHKGSHDPDRGGHLHEENPFNDLDLIQKDISADKFDFTVVPSRRIRVRDHIKITGRDLQAAARSQSDSWNLVVALATWKAEERRPHDHFDVPAACAGFEPNPFRWKTSGRLSHCNVHFLWSFFDGFQDKFDLKFARSNDLAINGRSIPAPAAIMNHSPEVLWARLKLTQDSYPLCKFLGEKIDDNRYEPDPAKWKAHPRSTAIVYFEFLHVTRENGERYLVHIHVYQLSNPHKDLPCWPLSKSAPKPVYFSIEYMEAFAAKKLEGSTFQGISFEGFKTLQNM